MSSSPIYASLDLGSNSFHLLIATFSGEKMVVIDDMKVMVRLAAGLRPDKTLSDDAMQKGLEALQLFADRLRNVDRQFLRVTGTSTLRQASNADSFLEKAEKILDAPIDIISGIEEARLIFLGVSKDYSPTTKRLIIDIGGGSTECVVGRHEPEHLDSLHMGCVQFTQQYFADGQITGKRYNDALLAARTKIHRIAEQIRKTRWREAVGASGTVRSIQQILLNEWQYPLITLAGLERLAEAIVKAGSCNKLKFSGLSENRRSILPGGLAILHALFIELNIDEMHTSDQALREGVIYEMAGRISYEGRREKTISQMQMQYHVDLSQAQRVAAIATNLLQHMSHRLAANKDMLDLLKWSAELHEIGLPINHSGYQKHGAYIIENSSMPGFSLQMQQSIAYLVCNHRRKIRNAAPHYRVTRDNHLLIAMRLACIFCRHRGKPSLPKQFELSFNDNVLKLSLGPNWLNKYPLVASDLDQEKEYLKTIGIELLINSGDSANGKSRKKV